MAIVNCSTKNAIKVKKLLLLLIFSLAITAIMPQRGRITLPSAVGDTWEHPSLIAPFDIPLAKSSEELEEDIVTVKELFAPIFTLDTTSSYLFKGDSLIYGIIQSGIIQNAEKERYADRVVRIATGNTTRITLASELSTLDQVQALASARGVPSSLSYQLQTNLKYDDKLNERALREVLDNISPNSGFIRASDLVIANGAPIDKAAKRRLESYTAEYEVRMGHSSWVWMMYLSRFALVMGILTLTWLMIKFWTGDIIHRGRGVLFIWSLFFAMVAMVSLSSQLSSLSVYIVPLPIVAIYLQSFFNTRIAVLGNIAIALLCSVFIDDAVEFFLLNFAGGMVGILMMRHSYHRINLFKAVGMIFIVQGLLLVIFETLELRAPSGATLREVIFVLAGNFLLLGFYQTTFLIERVFGFTSDVTLLELSDTNQKILLRLAQQAPGTFQHSVQVANLAESAAKAIGANALLARCGALYHDIGKMQNPFYFVENLTGTFNPHDDLNPLQSAEIIRGHVSDGVTIAREGRIPQVIIDFIERHHGDSLIRYFLSRAELQGEKTGEIIDPNDFRYPGERPITKEVSICMMADAVEAASRSLPSYEKDPLEAMVDKIIDSQIAQGEFSGSLLSFAEVETIKEVLKFKLNTIYHGRIAYPATK